MKTYNCLVLEDSISDQLAIEIVLEHYLELIVSYVKTPKEFLHELQKKKYDIFVIDIMLNDSLTGIDLVHSITDISAWVIISSSIDSKEYYELSKTLKFNKFFIKKPLDEFIFKSHLESFLNSKKDKKNEEPSGKHVILKQGNYLNKVDADDILMIETADHATSIYTDKSKYTTYKSLKFFEDLLKHSNFEKVNRNTLLNMTKISRINLKDNYIELGKYQISISKSKRQVIIDKYSNKVS